MPDFQCPPSGLPIFRSSLRGGSNPRAKYRLMRLIVIGDEPIEFTGDERGDTIILSNI